MSTQIYPQSIVENEFYRIVKFPEQDFFNGGLPLKNLWGGFGGFNPELHFNYNTIQTQVNYKISYIKWVWRPFVSIQVDNVTEARSEFVPATVNMLDALPYLIDGKQIRWPVTVGHDTLQVWQPIQPVKQKIVVQEESFPDIIFFPWTAGKQTDYPTSSENSMRISFYPIVLDVFDYRMTTIVVRDLQ